MTSVTVEDALRTTALDYLEGYWKGDATRVERALHPELAKRVRSVADGTIAFRTAKELIDKAADGSSRLETVPQIDFEVLGVYTNTATARFEVPTFVEWVHLTLTDDGWKIINLLCDLKPKS